MSLLPTVALLLWPFTPFRQADKVLLEWRVGAYTTKWSIRHDNTAKLDLSGMPVPIAYMLSCSTASGPVTAFAVAERKVKNNDCIDDFPTGGGSTGVASQAQKAG